MVYLALGINLLLMHDFVTSDIGHLENIGSIDYVDFLSVDTSLYNHIHKLTSLEKFYWEAIKLMVVDGNFPKF